MPVIHAGEAIAHEMHGTTFTSYAAPERGSSELCAWRVEVPGRTEGVPHQVTREEVLYMLSGSVEIGIDDHVTVASAGDAVVAPAGARVRLSNPGPEPSSAWVTTSAGFFAILPDGTWVAPPWTR